MDKHPGSSNSSSTAKTAIARFASANRRRLSGASLRTFLVIANHWGLTEKQRRLILGNLARSTYQRWVKKAREHQDITLSVDVLIRISAIFGIHIGLRTLFDEEQESVAWLRRPHDAQAFGGAAPLDLITSGFQDVLLTVRRFVDASRGGLYMSPSSAERDWPLYDDSEIIFVDREE